MKAAILLLFVFVASVSAICGPGRSRLFVFAKGHAKVEVYGHDVVKDLRVELVSYLPEDPKNVTVLTSADADDTGYYVIAGTDLFRCHLRRHYGLRLKAPPIGKHPVHVENGVNYETIFIPLEYVLFEGQPVKVFEKDIGGDKSIIS